MYLGHSNLIQTNKTVLTRAQILELGNALNAIHEFFAEAYYTGDPGDFSAMDVEFKFDDDWGDDGEQLWIKQARPYPGWGN